MGASGWAQLSGRPHPVTAAKSSAVPMGVILERKSDKKLSLGERYYNNESYPEKNNAEPC